MVNFVNGNNAANFLRSAQGWESDARIARERGEVAYARDCMMLADQNRRNASLALI
jgi:hypothetical protein